jgi:hypothetical protein
LELVRKQLERRRKENGSSKKMDQELEQDKNRKVNVQGTDTRDR